MFIKKLKQIITVSAFIALPVCGYAYDTVRVTPESGEPTDFKLSGHPVLTIDEDTFTMTTDNAVGVKFDASLAHSFTFIGEDGLEKIGMDGASLISLNGDVISLSGFAANTPVSIYTAGGVLVCEVIVGADGSAEISLTDMQHGVYVVNSSQIQFKFCK